MLYRGGEEAGDAGRSVLGRAFISFGAAENTEAEALGLPELMSTNFRHEVWN